MLGRHDLMLAILAAVGVIGCIAVFAAPSAQAAGPLVIAKQGYFFAGGRIDPSIDGSPMVGHVGYGRSAGNPAADAVIPWHGVPRA